MLAGLSDMIEINITNSNILLTSVYIYIYIICIYKDMANRNLQKIIFITNSSVSCLYG